MKSQYSWPPYSSLDNPEWMGGGRGENRGREKRKGGGRSESLIGERERE